MSFAKLPLLLLLLQLPLLVLLDLLSQSGHIGHVILFLQLLVVRSDNVLFLFLPTELLSLELLRVFHFFALLLESFIGLAIDFLQIGDVLLSFGFSVVVNFERALGSQKIRVSVIVVVS